MYKDTSQKGAANELIAVLWLMKQGYLVFRNVAPTGIFDIVYYNQELNKFKGADVKTIQISYNKPQFNRDAQEKVGVLGGNIIYVFPNGDCKFDYEIDPYYGEDRKGWVFGREPEEIINED